MSAIRKLSPVLEKEAKITINEDSNQNEENLKEIKEWISQQPHLKIPDNDQWILAFLRGCKYQLDRTKKKLDYYYAARTFFPEIFQNRDITVNPLREFINSGLILPFKSKINETQPLYVYHRFNFDPVKYDLNNLIKLYFIMYDIILLEYDEAVINGTIYIYDLSHITRSHITAFTPAMAKKSMEVTLQSYPLRYKGDHHLYPPSGFKTVLDLTKMLTPDKLKNQIHIHETLESLYKHIPMTDLPKDLGGDNVSIDELTEFWKSKLEGEYKEYLIKDEQYRSDEHLRVGKSIIDPEIYGVGGSFRKLAID